MPVVASPSFEALSPSVLAQLWLLGTHSGGGEVADYCYDISHTKGMAYYTDWLVALIDLADGETEIGNVGAGPIEATLETNIALARELESRVSRSKLRAVLQRMWFSDATPEVKNWALQLLDDGQSSTSRNLPHGLMD
jgi:hypothetical protein